MQAVLASRVKYLDAQNHMIALIEEGKREEADTMMFGEFSAVGAEYQRGNISEMIKFQSEKNGQNWRRGR